MKVEDIMTKSVRTVGPTTSIAETAAAMSDFDLGAFPVVAGQTLIGIVTDRDIAVRAVGHSIDVESPVSNVMTPQVATCLPEDSIEYALELMSGEKVRRLPVCTGDGELIGMITLADASERGPDKRDVGVALEKICEPSGVHCQTLISA